MTSISIQAPAQSRKYRLRWWTLLVLSVSLILIAVDTTILNVAIPTLQNDLDASASALQWIVSAYVLVFAGLLLTMGSLGDRFGRKRALQTGLVLFGVASLAAAYAQSSGQLIAARAFMGVGAALIMPATLSVIIDVFPKNERAKAIGIWAAAAGLGVPLGMVVGGWLLEQYWWGSVFLMNIPIGLVVLAAGYLLVPESRDPVRRKLDVVGAVLSTAALSLLIYAIIEAPERGWVDPLVVFGFAAATVLGAAFVLYELRVDQPMLDVRLFRNPRLSSGAVAISLAFMALLGMVFLLTQYLQFVRDYSPLQAGVRMVPLAIGFMVGAGSSDRLVAAFGTKRVVAGGLMILTAGLGVLAFMDGGTAYWIIAVGLFAFGLGMGNAMAPATAAVMGAVPDANAGVGSALNDVTRNLGGALGIGILGSVLNSLYSSEMASAVAGLPAGAAAAARNSIGAASQVAGGLSGPEGDALRSAANVAFTNALAVAMVAGAAITLAGAAIVLRFMPARALKDGAELDESPAPAELVLPGTAVPIPAEH